MATTPQIELIELVRRFPQQTEPRAVRILLSRTVWERLNQLPIPLLPGNPLPVESYYGVPFVLRHDLPDGSYAICRSDGTVTFYSDHTSSGDKEPPCPSTPTSESATSTAPTPD